MREIEERLNCVLNDERHWRKQLLDIKNKMSEYESRRRQNPGGNHESILKGILPTYWEVFHTHNIYRRCNRSLLCPAYDVGVFLVGFSTLPIVLSLAEIQPTAEIYFLYSRETEPMLKEISNRVGVMLPGSSLSSLVAGSIICPDHALEIAGSSDPVQTFKRIKEVINKVGDKRIALDLTGGKKTMLGGGFTAGSILSVEGSESLSACDMYYVDSLEYDSRSRAPKPGTEFLSQLKNPYDVYNVQSVQQAKKLFEKHNYEAAAELWEEVEKKLGSYARRYGLEREQDVVQKNLAMANCYRFWDAFDYEAARQHRDSWQYNKWHTRPSLDVLELLNQVRDRQTLFEDDGRVIHYAVDHYQSAVRRKTNGKLDDAIVRFTQVIEMLCIYKICKIAAGENLVEKSTNRCLHENWCRSERWGIKALINFLFDKDSRYDNQYEIKNAQFLQESDYDRVDRIIRLIQPRNKFIHFTRRMNQDVTTGNANNLQQLALKFIENLSCQYRADINGLSCNDLLKLHEFCLLE